MLCIEIYARSSKLLINTVIENSDRECCQMKTKININKKIIDDINKIYWGRIHVMGGVCQLGADQDCILKQVANGENMINFGSYLCWLNLKLYYASYLPLNIQNKTESTEWMRLNRVLIF